LCPIHFHVFCGNGWETIEFSVYTISENSLNLSNDDFSIRGGAKAPKSTQIRGNLPPGRNSWLKFQPRKPESVAKTVIPAIEAVNSSTTKKKLDMDSYQGYKRLIEYCSHSPFV
jgi:hypothetical protein